MPRNDDACTCNFLRLIYKCNKKYFAVATVNFSQSLYSIAESSGAVEIFMVLSNPSPTDITVQVLNTEGSATGKIIFNIILNFIKLCMQVKIMALLCHTVLYFILG